MGGDELRGEAGALREAGEDDAVERDAGGKDEVDDGLDAGEGGVEEGLVLIARDEEGVGVPGEAFGLGGEEGDRSVGRGQRAGEGEDVSSGAAATVEKDDGAFGLIESSAGAVEFAVGVGIFGRAISDGPFVEGDAGEGRLEAGAAGFEPGGKAEALAEGFEGLVDGEAGVVGG